ncbi:MAG TPA: hypothetical protein VIX87_08900 [Steroidobacteraceae bacterium]
MNPDNDRTSAAPLDETLDNALDQALTRALQPPQLPGDFRAALTTAIARATELEAAARRARPRLEREQRQRLAEFEAGYVQLRRRTLGTLIGGAFAAGAAVAVVLPWLRVLFGPEATLALAALGAAAGLAIGTASWIGRIGLPASLSSLWRF